MADPVPAEEARVLLGAARDAIEAAVTGRPEARPEAELAPSLREPRATFVTLRSADGALRGCIGELVARRALVDSVRGCAISAATRDPRFPPVEPAEVGDLQIGISILTPSSPIRPEQVEVGRHGLVIERGARRGVLLPEVASDRGWDAQTFLVALCRKAGLPDDAWGAPDTQLSAFESLKVAEPRR